VLFVVNAVFKSAIVLGPGVVLVAPFAVLCAALFPALALSLVVLICQRRLGMPRNVWPSIMLALPVLWVVVATRNGLWEVAFGPWIDGALTVGFLVSWASAALWNGLMAKRLAEAGDEPI
jgi:hypothetical protein